MDSLLKMEKVILNFFKINARLIFFFLNSYNLLIKLDNKIKIYMLCVEKELLVKYVANFWQNKAFKVKNKFLNIFGF